MFTNVRIRTKLIVTFVAMALITALTGFFGIYFTSLAGYRGGQIGTDLTPIADAAMEIQLNATNAQLIFEKVLSSDSTVTIEEVWSKLDYALSFCDAVLNGGVVGEIVIPASQDAKTRGQIEQVKAAVKSISSNMQGEFQRYQQSLEASEEADQNISQLFFTIQNALNEIENDLVRRKANVSLNLVGTLRFLLADSYRMLDQIIIENSPEDFENIVLNFNQAKQTAAVIEKRSPIEPNLSKNIDLLAEETQKRFELLQTNREQLALTRSELNRDFEQFVKNAEMAEISTLDLIHASQVSLNKMIARSRYILIAITVVGFLIGILLAVFLGFYIAKQTDSLKQSANILAIGSTAVTLQTGYQDEFGELFASFQKMIDTLQAKTKLAEQIGLGKLAVEVDLASEQDVLGLSMRKMIESLRKKTEIAREIAQGNLVIDAALSSDDDELGLAFQQMIQNLNDVLLRVASIANELKEGSAQISVSSQGLSQAVNEQAASLEEISSSMEELDGQTRSNAGHAKSANEKAVESKLKAEMGYQQMQEMVKAMNEINAMADQISNIVKTIDEIAFQTNVLAINAAVEAARAGEHGKGFAVVAEEVRNLAQRSAQASKETTAMIKNSIKKIETGAKIARDTAHSLNTIMHDAGDVSELVNKIVGSSNEQALGVSQVNQGITQLNSVVQSNAGVADQTAASSERLDNQADMLKQLVSRFQLKGQAYLPEPDKKLAFRSGAKQLPSGTVHKYKTNPDTKPKVAKQETQEFDDNIILFENENVGRF